MLSDNGNQRERRFLEKGIVAKLTAYTGWGLFADTDFAPGETIFWMNLEDTARSRAVPFLEAFGECYDRGVTMLPGFVFCCTAEQPLWSVNHSCNANGGYVNWGKLEAGQMAFAAYRHIRRGEQITMDYSPITAPYDGTPDGGPWQMTNCMCKQPTCRGTIGGLDVLPYDLQLQALLPAQTPYGRIIAHILDEVPGLVSVLRANDEAQYDRYRDVLREQRDFAAYLANIQDR